MIQPTRDDAGAVGESCGERLRKAREEAGLGLAELSARLHMPVSSLRALEEDDWGRAGAPIFVRGQLRSYARELGVELDPEQVDSQLGGLAPPPLVSHSHVPRYRHLFEQGVRRAMYIAITAIIAVPVWWQTRPHLSNDVEVRNLDVVPSVQSKAASPIEPGAELPERTPVLASIGGMRPSSNEPRSTAPQAAPVVDEGLVLRFSGESWVEVAAPDGTVIEQALLGEGDVRRYPPGKVGGVVLGNATAVEVRSAGRSVDLTGFARANVARFALSSDGSLRARAD